MTGGLKRRRCASERPRMTPRNISIITGVAMLACRPPSSSPCNFILHWLGA